jgi:arylsulfatase A
MALTHAPFVPTPDSVTPENRNKIGLKYFADMVAYMDKIIGKIVRKVDELGIRENTVILFTGDNGTNLAIESRMQERTVHGGKGTPTDAGTHVPLIVNWLGTSPSGRECDVLIDFSDFFPTLAQVSGAEIPGNLTVDGRSFLPQIKGEEGIPREWVFCHYEPRWSIWKPCRFVRDKRWKLYGDGRLFDLRADPLEKSPLGDSRDKELVAIRRKFQQILDRMK